MTLSEASKAHGVTVKTLKIWIREGILQAEKRYTETGLPYWWVTGEVPQKRRRGNWRREPRKRAPS